jgi:hypothetical protein
LPVPAFHRLNADAVPDLDSVPPQGPPQSRLRTGEQFLIAGDRQTDGMQVLLKTLNVLHRAKAQNGNCAHPRAPCFGNQNAGVAPSNAILMKIKPPPQYEPLKFRKRPTLHRATPSALPSVVKTTLRNLPSDCGSRGRMSVWSSLPRACHSGIAWHGPDCTPHGPNAVARNSSRAQVPSGGKQEAESLTRLARPPPNTSPIPSLCIWADANQRFRLAPRMLTFSRWVACTLHH